MPRAVGDQLWQLTFSFAVRSLLGMLDVQDNLKFQYAHGLIISYNKADSSLQKLLMAYKLSSTHRGEHGIFPFRIIKCSHNQTQLHVAFEEEAEHLEEYLPEQMNYIVNFKLVLSFSEHTMTPYEVYKVIRAITMEYELNRTQNDAAAAAAVIKLPTVYTLFKHFVGNVDNIDNLRRVFINFKRLLYVRTNLNYCTIEPFNDGMPRIEINEDGDVRAECQDGFHEHPSYFAHAIRIDKHQCKEIVQTFLSIQLFTRFSNQIEKILAFLNRNFPNCLFRLLRSSNAPARAQCSFSDQVELDGKDRSLAFPILLGEQLLDRVYQLIEDGTNSICKIGETLDFVKTVQNIVASTGQFNFAQRSKAISPRVNSQLFKLFFSLAIRLTLMPPDDYLANNCFLQNQISNKKEQIKIQLCLECENNDKIQEKIKKNFEFLLFLPDYSPSVYEVLKLAKELGNTSNDNLCGDNSEIENEKGKNLKARDELCEDKFGEENSKTIEQNNILHFGKAISINFNAKNDLQQIVPLIMKEVQEIFAEEKAKDADLLLHFNNDPRSLYFKTFELKVTSGGVRVGHQFIRTVIFAFIAYLAVLA
uniref:Uncharacterized protein n=1 Tax=Globodera rostochiensis TaxID=31243 RepID=A0A914I2S2_GLORO